MVAAGGDLGSPTGDEVDGREVFEHLDRVGGGQHGDGAREADVLGGLSDGGEHDSR